MGYLLELDEQIYNAKARIAEAEKVVAEEKVKLRDLLNKAWECPECKRYYPLEKCNQALEQVTNTEITYSDAGYGDNDEIGEVTRAVTYIICPVCGKKKPLGKGVFLYEKNTRPRRGC